MIKPVITGESIACKMLSPAVAGFISIPTASWGLRSQARRSRLRAQAKRLLVQSSLKQNVLHALFGRYVVT